MVSLVKVLKPSRAEDEMTRLVNESPLKQEVRHYNGLSAIGTKCVRLLQYHHYDCLDVTHSCRMIRLFGVGHRMEDVLIEELNRFLQLNVSRQQEECVGFAGHWKGHIDGVGNFYRISPFYKSDNDKFLMEFKTHNDKSFADLKKNGVKASKPLHYGQVTSYMGHIKLERCLYVGYNKNTSEIYLEWIPFTQEDFKENQRKEAEVVVADTLLPRIGNDSPMWHECKMCDAKKVCFGEELPKPSCKNCQFVDVHDEGRWECTKSTSNKLESFDICHEYKLSEFFNVD